MQLNDDWSNCKECPPLYSIAQQQLPFSPLHNTAPPPTKKSTKEAGLLKSEKKAHLESKQSPKERILSALQMLSFAPRDEFTREMTAKICSQRVISLHIAHFLQFIALKLRRFILTNQRASSPYQQRNLSGVKQTTHFVFLSILKTVKLAPANVFDPTSDRALVFSHTVSAFEIV